MSDIRWHDFTEEKPNYGDVILWLHCQAINDLPEVVVYDRDTEWIEGDIWAKVDIKHKRKPHEDGFLPMTGSEFKKIEKIIGRRNITTVFLNSGRLWYRMVGYAPAENLAHIEAILYLNKLFDLGVKQ